MLAEIDQNLIRQKKIMPAGMINFCHNDYLGLAQHDTIKMAFKRGVDQYGVGSGASALITGFTPAHQQVELQFAQFVNQETAFLFPTGYMANIGVLSTLPKRGDCIFMDKHNHASLIDGARLSRATLKRYQHLSMEHLEHLLITEKNNHQQSYIVTDAVFSMSGDLAPLTELLKLSQQYEAILIIDEAHSLGVLGETGRGIFEYYHCLEQAHSDNIIRVCPLGKAFGAQGGMVAGPDSLMKLLLQAARSYIYTTAMCPAIACAIGASVDIIQQEPWRRQAVKNFIDLFQSQAALKRLNILPSKTAIQGIVLNSSEKALKASWQLAERGFWINAIRPPTVPVNTARLRITLSALHSEDQVVELVQSLGEIIG